MNDRLCSCGASNHVDAVACWLCGQRLNPAVPGVVAQTAPPAHSQFSLASLLMMVTLVAVCLGLFRVAPGLGILMGFVGVPAMIRTGGVVRRRSAGGRAMTGAERVEVFLVSAAIVFFTILSACVAFCATCFPIGIATLDFRSGSGLGIMVAFGVGILAGLGTLVLMIRWLWPDRRAARAGGPPPPYPPEVLQQPDERRD